MPIQSPGLFLAALAAMTLVGCAATGPRQITILHTNDMHGRHTPFHVAPGDATAQTGDPGRSPSSFDRAGRIGGFEYLAGAVRAIREREGADNVLLLDGGDTFGDDLLGNLTRGEAMIRLMNAVGYDAMALGNHDFDYGADRTAELQVIAKFPMRGANVLGPDGAPFLGDPVGLLEAGGARVGILSLGYHNTDKTGSKANVRGLKFTSGIEAARARIPALRERADIVVVLSHQGSKVDRELAKLVPGIDLIVGAHSHDRITPPEKIGETWIAQAMSDGVALGELTLTLNGGRLTGVAGRIIDLWNDRIAPDPKVAALADTLRAPHRPRLEEVLATATARIGRQYKSESPFDALAGEILRERTGAEIAFLPGVGYGLSIEPGPVTRERLYTLLPHPTKMVTMKLTGRQVIAILEQSATNQKTADPLAALGGLIQTSGLRWRVDLNRPQGQRVSQVSVAGAKIEMDRSYSIVTHAGLRGGLHLQDEFAQGRDIVEHGEIVTDVVEAGVIRRGTIGLPQLGLINLVPATEQVPGNAGNHARGGCVDHLGSGKGAQPGERPA